MFHISIRHDAIISPAIVLLPEFELTLIRAAQRVCRTRTWASVRWRDNAVTSVQEVRATGIPASHDLPVGPR